MDDNQCVATVKGGYLLKSLIIPIVMERHLSTLSVEGLSGEREKIGEDIVSPSQMRTQPSHFEYYKHFVHGTVPLFLKDCNSVISSLHCMPGKLNRISEYKKGTGLCSPVPFYYTAKGTLCQKITFENPEQNRFTGRKTDLLKHTFKIIASLLRR